MAIRLFLSLWIGLLSAGISWHFWSEPRAIPSDFFQVWAGARALLDGLNPYDQIGPGRPYEWNFPLLYPLPAVLVGVPFAFLSIRAADPLFVGLGASALAWALTQRRVNNPQLLLFFSAAYLFALQTSQWSPVLMAAALLPPLSPLLAAKPHLAIALLAAYPRRIAVLATAAFVLLTTVLFPWWPAAWLDVLPAAGHMTPLVARWKVGGPILLLAMLRWRQPEGRLLLAMACVPHTPLPYEALPLFLVARRARESAALCLLSVIVVLGVRAAAPYADHDAWVQVNAVWVIWGLYVPALALVLLRRPARPDADRSPLARAANTLPPP